MTFITTASGRELDFLNPDKSNIVLNDILIGLHKTSRFAGQYEGDLYTVLEHSVLVYDILKLRQQEEYLLEGLLHDAHEAYTGDVPTPLKRLCADFENIEQRLDKVIRMKYHLPPQMSQAVKEADRTALYIESQKIKRCNSPVWEKYKTADVDEIRKALPKEGTPLWDFRDNSSIIIVKDLISQHL